MKNDYVQNISLSSHPRPRAKRSLRKKDSLVFVEFGRISVIH